MVSPVGLISLLTVLLHCEFFALLFVTDFDLVFHVTWPEQQEMVSIEEIIAIQKREEAAQKVAAQKQQLSAEEADQGAPNVKGPSSTSQGKEKGITIREGATQAKRSAVVEKVS